MKTIKSILVAFVLVCMTSMSAANNPSDNKKAIQQASEEIAEMLKSPSFEVTEKLTTQVSLFVNNENELVVLSVNTDNKELENYVKARLNYQKLSYGLEQGKEYKLPLTINSKS
jgi:uncharacterized protein YpmB